MTLQLNSGTNTGVTTMKLLTEDWQPSQAIMEKYKEVNHDREIKYFRYFYIHNQYRKENWDNEYCKWCDKQLSRRSNNQKICRQTKPSHQTDSFFHRIITELSDK